MNVSKFNGLFPIEVYGGIFQFIPVNNLLNNTIISHSTFPETILLHYPFKFSHPKDFYVFNINELKTIIKNPHININMIFLYLCKCGENNLVKIILKNTLKPTKYIKYRLDLKKYSHMAISSAIRYDNENILRSLLSDPRINLEEIYKEYKFIFMSKRFNLIKILISDSRVDLSKDDDILCRLISRYGTGELMEYILKNGNIDPTTNDNEAIINACKYGNIDIVKMLMSIHSNKKYSRNKRINLFANNNGAFIGAIVNNHLKIIKILLNPINNHLPINPSVGNNMGIRLAAKLGHHNIVKYLISLLPEYGIDPSVCNNEAIRLAVTRNHKLVVKELLKDVRVNPNVNLGTLLRLSIKHKYVEITEYLQNDYRIKSLI